MLRHHLPQRTGRVRVRVGDRARATVRNRVRVKVSVRVRVRVVSACCGTALVGATAELGVGLG